MSFDPDALRALGGDPPTPRRPVTLAFLFRVGLAAALAGAGCDVAVWLVARWRDWDLIAPGGQQVGPLGIVLVCLVVGSLAALGTYVAARVTKRPAVWVALVGAGLFVASIQGLPRTLQVMHLLTAAWIVGWMTRAVLRGSHLR